MPVVFLHDPTELVPGDTLLSRFDWTCPSHWLVAGGTGSPLVHVTMVSEKTTQEWSVQERGTILRPVASDTACWAYRPNDPNWKDIQLEAAKFAAQHPVSGYNWGGGIWLGVQKRIAQRPLKPFLSKHHMFCFEWHTDIYEQIGYDLVPELLPGQVGGDDIAASAMVLRI